MKLPDTAEELTALFRKLGAPDPEGWASSQIEEGIPQLQRFLWLREAWRLIVSDDDFGWIDAQIKHAEKRPNDPYAGVGIALQRCLAKGVEKETLNEIVRGMQAQLLFGLVTCSKIRISPKAKSKTCPGVYSKSTSKETRPIILAGCTSPCWKRIRPAEKCGPKAAPRETARDPWRTSLGFGRLSKSNSPFFI